jgi:NitT/TauT family transport system ATP-binding protein
VDAAVDIRGLEIAFNSASGPLTVLSNFDLTVKRNEFVSLIGPSGCGKTTVLRCIANLLQPTAGEVLVNGKDPRAAVKSRQIGYVFQSATLLEWRNVLKNVLLPLELAGVRRKEAVPRAEAMIERVGLGRFMKHYPRQLSGGMQQRVAIARAMVMEPDTILMDEPFAALDEMTRDDMNQWLTEVFMATDSTVLFVTHNIREAIQLSDRVVVMAARPGRIVEEYAVPFPRPRTAEQLFSDEFNALRQRAEQALYGAAHAMREVTP